jgi:hypothetical protein
MSDFVGFNFVPYGDENEAETVFREHLEQFLARLDVDRVRSSGARARALLIAVRGAFEASWNNFRAEPIRKAEVFDRFALAFGWRGDEAKLLAMWFGLAPNTDDCTTRDEWEARLREAVESLRLDPYSRHEAFWERCENQGVDSFMRFWGHHTEPFDNVLALIDEAAKALGDE